MHRILFSPGKAGPTIASRANGPIGRQGDGGTLYDLLGFIVIVTNEPESSKPRAHECGQAAGNALGGHWGAAEISLASRRIRWIDSWRLYA